MRSKQLKELNNDVSGLNNHYAHFLFISEQFIEDSRNKINQYSMEQKQKLLTKDVFKDNRFAPQFNVRLNELEVQSQSTKQFILKSLFLLSFFQFEVYLKDIYNFVKSFESSLPELNPKRSALTQINDHLQPVDSTYVNQDDMNTLEYLKLRRNALVHRDVSRVAQGELKKFINANGKNLNRYWNRHPTKLQSLDFTTKDEKLALFADKEVIDVLKLIRWLSVKIDAFMMNTIGEERLQTWLLDEFRSAHPNFETAKASGLTEKFNGKFKRFAIITLGIQYTNEQVRSLLGE